MNDFRRSYIGYYYSPLGPMTMASDGKSLTGLWFDGQKYDRTMAYGQIATEAAARMGRKRMSAQAVVGAVGHNCVSLIIPCHRVVGADGSLTGYAGGLERKIWLLEHEQK